MKTKAGWLVVILISSVQLVLLLFAVMTLFSWFLSQTETTVRNQTCGDNQVIASQVMSAFESATRYEARDGMEGARSSESDRDRLFDVLSRIQMPNRGFVVVIDKQSRKSIFPGLQNAQLMGIETGLEQFTPINEQDSAAKTSLIDSMSQTPSSQFATGEIRFNDHRHFVSAIDIPSLNSVLVVGQQSSESLAGISATIQSTGKVVFGATLLMGLACICLIVSILNRITARVDDMSQGLENQVSEREKELVKTRNAVIFGLAKLAESRDNDTGEHLDRIRSYVLILCKGLADRIPEIDTEFTHNLALASSLHDVGKVGIPDSILLKPGRLTVEEREIMQLHTLIGGECLEAIQSRLGDNVFMYTAKQVAYYHHERWDGEGYPHGLANDDIPLVARIVAVADVYDALTSKRPYKKPFGHLESKDIILAGSGTQFDPEIVAAFSRHEDEFEAISRAQQALNDKDVLTDFHVLCERAQTTVRA